MKEKKDGNQSNFSFDKMPYQEKEESGEELQEFDRDSEQELELGESKIPYILEHFRNLLPKDQ